MRGSSLLLFGRLFSLVVNLAAQVLVVRAFSKSDYGAFAYALSMIAMAQHVSLLGLNKAVARFVPIFQERGDYRAVFGTILTALATVIGLGLALMFLTFGLRGVLVGSVVTDPLAVALMMTLIALAPLQSLDHVFQSLLSVFARPRAIFFRRYVLKPLLKLAAILLVMAVHGDVQLLATCQVVAGVIGAVLYAMILWQVLRDEHLLEKFDARQLRYPVRRIFRFSVPLLSSNLVLALKTAMDVFLLERIHGSQEVAGFRGVVPVANLTLIVMQSFRLLYVPMASRLFARHNDAAVNNLFWQSAVWTAVMTFPIFAVSVFLAEPLTVLLFGSRYAESATVLAILAAGNYLNAAVGLNADTLEAYARVRAIAIITIITGVVALGLNYLLIPPFGAAGAALATVAAVAARNIANHTALAIYTAVKPFDRSFWKVYASVALSVGVLALARSAHLPAPLLLVLVIVATAAIVRVNRSTLNIAQTFPALSNVPVLRLLVGARSAEDESKSS